MGTDAVARLARQAAHRHTETEKQAFLKPLAATAKNLGGKALGGLGSGLGKMFGYVADKAKPHTQNLWNKVRPGPNLGQRAGALAGGAAGRVPGWMARNPVKATAGAYGAYGAGEGIYGALKGPGESGNEGWYGTNSVGWHRADNSLWNKIKHPGKTAAGFYQALTGQDMGPETLPGPAKQKLLRTYMDPRTDKPVKVYQEDPTTIFRPDKLREYEEAKKAVAKLHPELRRRLGIRGKYDRREDAGARAAQYGEMGGIPFSYNYDFLLDDDQRA